MSYNDPPPSYEVANKGIIPGHIMQTPLGPIQPHIESMKPASGEFMNSMVNPYASPKQRPNPQTNDSYSSDVKVPYSQTSQLESGPYPRGTLTYSNNVGSDTVSYQSPPNSYTGNGPPPRYQSMPSPRMPSQPVGTGVTPGGIYPSVGYSQQPPYPTETFERGLNRAGAAQGYPMPRPITSTYDRNTSPPLAGRIDQMNISGSPNNYSSGQRPYSSYSQNPAYPPSIGSGTAASYQNPPSSNIGSGTAPYRNSPSPIIGSGTSREYSSPPIGHGTSQRYSSPIIGSGTSGYPPPNAGYPLPRPYPTPYNTPISNMPSRSSNYLPPRLPVGSIGPPIVPGYGSAACTSVPSSHGDYCSQYPSTNYCNSKRKNSSSSSSSSSTDSSISAHHSHHHHHHC